MEKVLAKNNVTIFGKGNQPILFVHGYGCDQNMWRLVTPAFENDYKIILIDLVGSGKSDESAYEYEKYSSLQGYADDIVELCDTLNLTNVIFVGHSVSAMIGVLAAQSSATLFKDLILIGPSPCYINKGEYYGGFSQQDIDELLETVESNYLGWSSAMAPVIMGNPDRPELAEELENSFCQNNPDIAKHFAKVTFSGDNRKDLAQVTLKTLILQSSQDAIASKRVGAYVHDSIENSTLVVLDAIGHCPHLSAPDQTVFAIKTYLN